MKNKKKIIFALAIFTIAQTIYFFQKKDRIKKSDSTIGLENSPTVFAPLPSLQKNILPTSSLEKKCSLIKKDFEDSNQVKKNEFISIRFVNLHKKIDGIIFRLRFFYKDGDEGEIPTYLLYEEDANAEEHIIEKTAYKKGELYKKIEKKNGTIIYKEEGMTIPNKDDLFLHFINGQLKRLQLYPSLDCQFEKETQR